MSRLQRTLMCLTRFSSRFPKSVLFVALLVSLFCTIASVNIHFNMDITDLLSEKLPMVKSLRDLEKKTSGGSFQIVTVQSPDPKANQAFLKKLGARLAKSDKVELVLSALPAKFFEKRALLYADLKDLKAFKKRLKKKIQYENKQNNPLFVSLTEEKDPGLSFGDIESKYNARLEKMKAGLTSEQGRFQGLLIRPTENANNAAFSRKFVRELKEAVAATQPASFHKGMQIGYFGDYTLILNEVDSITMDIVRSSVITGVLLLLLLFLFFRRVRLLLLVSLPLLVGMAWTVGFAYLAIGSLNMITGFIGVILLGLGIDYSIHLISRYQDERAQGKDVQTALEESFGHTGEATLFGAMTTAATFLTLSISQFKGFSEFGLIAGVGILLCLCSIFSVLPALIVCLHKVKAESAPKKQKRLQLSHETKAFPWARTIAGTASVLLIFFVGLSFALRFEYRQYKVSYLPKGEAAYLKETKRIQKLYPRSLNPTIFAVKDGEKARRLMDTLESYKTTPSSKELVGDILSAVRFLPEKQKQKYQVLKEINLLLKKNDVEEMVSGKTLKRLQEWKPLLAATPFGINELPMPVQKMFLTKDGGHLVYSFSHVNFNNGEKAIQLKDLLSAVEVDSKVYVPASPALIYGLLLSTIFEDGLRSILIALGLVIFLLLVSFRSFKMTFLALLPLMFGLFGMLALMAWFDIRLSFINIVAIPVLIGVGLDNGVHLIHRYLEDPKRCVRSAWLPLWKPLSLATLTSVLGFVGMLFCSHSGLKGIGVLATIGMGTCLLGSLLVLPAFMQTLGTRSSC